jgi:DNA polymerase delta subunit 2
MDKLADDPVYVPRVLDVQKGKLCYIVGTVYMDMPLKPNVLVDIGKEVRLLEDLFPHQLDSCM